MNFLSRIFRSWRSTWTVAPLSRMAGNLATLGRDRANGSIVSVCSPRPAHRGHILTLVALFGAGLANGTGLDGFELPSNLQYLAETNGKLQLSVWRTEAGPAASVGFATSNGTAIAGSDFVAQMGVLHFAAGERTKSVALSALDDGLWEGEEVFTVHLFDPSIGTSVGRHSVATVAINDNECLPSLVDGTFDPGLGVSVPLNKGGDDPGFSLFSVYALAVQPDGKVIVGGDFPSVEGVARTGLARLRADGSLDTAFAPVLGDSWRLDAIRLQPDGRILIGGNFTSVNGTGRTNFAALTPDGALDTSFGGGLPSDWHVRAIVLAPDEKVVVGGWYKVDNGQPSSFVVRFDTNGVLDATFQALPVAPYSTVIAMAMQPDGRVLVAGGFERNGSGDAAYALFRLNSNGTRDLSFGLPGDFWLNSAHAVGVEPSGKIVVGGIIRHGRTNSPLARLMADGSLDPTFQPDISTGGGLWTVQTLAVQPDGKVIVGGSIHLVEEAPRYGIARLDSDGSLDRSFDPGTGVHGIVYATALANDGRVLLAGNFSEVNRVRRRGIARLLPANDGLVAVELGYPNFNTKEPGTVALNIRRCGDSTGTLGVAYTLRSGTATAGLDFDPLGGEIIFGPMEVVKTIVVTILDDQTIEADELFHVDLIAPGGGSILGALPSATVTIVDNDHSPSNLDRGFAQSQISAGDETAVLALALEPDGKVLIAGDFGRVGGQRRNFIARLTEEGRLDESFDAGAGIRAEEEPSLFALALQPDGRILIGGYFSSISGAPLGLLARLHRDGAVDSSLQHPLLGHAVRAIVVQNDGKLLVGGEHLQAGPNFGVVRLNADGSQDTNFAGTTGRYEGVAALALDRRGRILIGGGFAQANGVTRYNLARLQNDGVLDPAFAPQVFGGGLRAVRAIRIQSDGGIVIAGSFESVNGVPRCGVARLHDDGSLDGSFDPGGGFNAEVSALLIQDDGRIVAAGAFTKFNGARRLAIARLHRDGSLDVAFDPQFPRAGAGSALASRPDGRVIAGGWFCYAGEGGDLDEYETCVGVLQFHPDPPPILRAVQLGSVGSIRFDLHALPERDYVLETSEDLMRWEPIRTNRPGLGPLRVSLPVRWDSPQRYYRAVSSP